MNEKFNLILGTMTFGEQLFGNDVTEMIRIFEEKGYQELDTAYVYNEGKCEQLIGASLKELHSTRISVSTKVNPRITGRLDKDAVRMQLNESLFRMGVDSVKTLYLHFPDYQTPVELALEACAELYDEGKFQELGISNFPAWMVADIYHKCKINGWMIPKVYQGLYNPLSRKVETELNRALDYFGMRFYAYNPLAGGILSNKYNGMKETPAKGRFTYRPNYQERYWKASYLMAAQQIKESCIEENIDIVEAAYRWLAYHSMLNFQRGDAIIVGASTKKQLEENLHAIEKGPLPDKICNVIDSVWETCRADSPEYFRFILETENAK